MLERTVDLRAAAYARRKRALGSRRLLDRVTQPRDAK